MKVIIDTEEKTFKIIGWVTIPELTEFVDKHGFGEYVMKLGDSTAYNADKVITNEDEPFRPDCNAKTTAPINPDDYVWVNSPLVGNLNTTKEDPDDGLDTRL